jgi:hypothetical protein
VSSPARRLRAPRPAPLGVALVAFVLAVLVLARPAHADAPWWRLDSSAVPTNLKPGDAGDLVVVTASNLGDATVDGKSSPVVITDTLPSGVTPTTATVQIGNVKTSPVGCVVSAQTVTCEYKELLRPYELLEVLIVVNVKADAKSGEQDVASVSGGQGPGGIAPAASSLGKALSIANEPTTFGIQRAEVTPESASGGLESQAGAHPFQLTTTLHLNEVFQSSVGHGTTRSVPTLLKDAQFQLPPGLIGNPLAVEQCTSFDFTTVGANSADLCGRNTVVGVALVTLLEPNAFGVVTKAVPIFNLVPAVGEPARLGFYVVKDLVILDTSVRTGEDYGVTVSVNNASEVAKVLSSQVTIWGVPGDSSHDESRGWECVANGENLPEAERLTSCPLNNPSPFLTLPTYCGTELKTVALADSWLEPATRLPDGRVNTNDPHWKQPPTPVSSSAQQGCAAIPFEPSITLAPDTQSGSTPAGLKVNVDVPQGPTLTASEVGESAVKSTTVALPVGMELNPAAADGLTTCSRQQIGFTGSDEATQTDNDEFSPFEAECPDAAKVGTVKIKTPLLRDKLEGSAYLAQQNTNPFQPPIVLYLIARDPTSGVLVKLAGHVTPDASTGQLVSTFEHTPPLPFEDLEVNFFNGPRASVSTPPLCGTYTTTTAMTPWSGNADASPSSNFVINSGAGGSGCADPQPFAPGFQAGSTSLAPGAFTPFTTEFSRPDPDQAISTVTVRLPPGMAAMLASVVPCPEPQAAQGTCGPDSLIGHSTASAGYGSGPIALGGQVFITGPYKGAPFGLSIVTPAIAGPFNLGNVIVRSTINIDPNTAAVTITSDPLPTRLKGVPTQIQKIRVTVDRPGFQFNPTNCTPKTIGGTLTGAQGASANVSSSFQVDNCASLPFHPKLTASAGGQASKANGASLNVNVTSAGLGQANIQKVFLTLPKALPSRLTTIQKACADSIFNANPANCNEGSVIGTATIHTPVLKSALSGPAYLVSHGNAAFPDVEFVLQGEGITLILDGKTDIKKGITYSRFESTPDAPFTTFETKLPTGPHSALTANVPENEHYSLCKTKLVIPTEITAQNGAVIKQETKVGLTGCVAANKAKALSRAQKLKKALRHCSKRFAHNKKKRAACRKEAYKKYGPKKKASKHSSKAKK